MTDRTCYILVFCAWLFITLPLLMLCYKFNDTWPICLAVSTASGILLYMLCRARRASGLYIVNDSLYYRGFFCRKKIIPGEIAGIKIIKACTEGIFLSYELKDKDNKTLYNAIFVSAVIPEMSSYNVSDLYFQRRYRKHIICSVIYDQELISYIEKLNPQVVIL